MCIIGKIQVTEELKKGWQGEEGCQLCGRKESANHLLFTCPVAFFCCVFCGTAWAGIGRLVRGRSFVLWLLGRARLWEIIECGRC